MRWILLDVALVLAGLALLGVLLLRVWRRVVALGREVARAAEALGRATDDLARLTEAAHPGPGSPADQPDRRGTGPSGGPARPPAQGHLLRGPAPGSRRTLGRSV